MRKNKTLLIIAAVAVMLVAATNASAYHEHWDGWFNSGYLTYDGYTYNHVEGIGGVADTTNGDVDEFFLDAITVITFYCSGTDGTIVVRLTSSSGSKPTGQEDQKEGSGNWGGTAVLTRPGLPNVNFTTLVGTWDTNDAGDYFNYAPETPTYSAKWYVSYSDPDGLTGAGGSAGYRIVYRP